MRQSFLNNMSYMVLLGNIYGKQMLLPEATLRRLLPPKVRAKVPAAPKM